MKLLTNYNEFEKEVVKLQSIHSELIKVSPRYSKMIAEIILLRLFAVLEEQICSIACKMVLFPDSLFPTKIFLFSRATYSNVSKRLKLKSLIF